MKPRPGWTIADGNASARRKDGVVAGFEFPYDEKPYAVKRQRISPRRGKTDEWLIIRGKSLTFRTLEKAMEAADKTWPLT
jgi:hypothetical protein